MEPSELDPSFEGGETESPVTDVERQPSKRGHPGTRRHLRGFAVGGAAIVAVGVALLVVALLPAATPRTPGSSPGRPWGLAVSPGAGARAASGWQLAASTTTPGWSGGTTAPVMGGLTCPVASRCYLYPLVAGSAPSLSARAISSMSTSFFVSTDGGRDWSGSGALPSGVRLTTGMSCPTGDGVYCLAGGQSGNADYLLVTSDGGTTWTERSLPAGIGSIWDLSCASESQCVALVTSKYVSGVARFAQLYVTTNSGSTWTHIPTPANYQGYFVSCHGLSCVAEGEIWSPATAARGNEGAIFYSTDGGTSWKASTLPAGFFTDNMSYLTCSSASYCIVTGTEEETASGSAAPGPPYLSSAHPDAGGRVIEMIAATNDGGATWRLLARPASMGMLFQMSCPVPGDCWAGSEGSHGAPTLIHTTDGGSSWSRVSLPALPPEPNVPGSGGPTPIGQVQCPTVSECIATAIVYPGQKAPVYTYSGG